MTTVDVGAYRRFAYALAHGVRARERWCVWEVDDLAQEAMIAMWQAGARHNPDKGALPSYVATAARMRINDLVYRKRPVMGAGDRTRTHGSRADVRTTSLDAYLDSNPDVTPRMLVAAGPDADELSTREAVRLAVLDLPEREWLAVWTVDLLGMTAAEAAPHVGVVADYVRTLRQRAYKRLRETLVTFAGDAATA